MERKRMDFFRKMFGVRKPGCCTFKIEEVDTKDGSDDKQNDSGQSPRQGCSCGCCCDEKQQ